MLHENYSLKHLPSHTHNEVQGKLALQHLHLLFLQLVLQPQRTSSWQEIAASGSVHHLGYHVSSVDVQPHPSGCGSWGISTVDWPQSCPPWFARLTCCSSAFHVGGSPSKSLPLLVNKYFLAPLTLAKGHTHF